MSELTKARFNQLTKDHERTIHHAHNEYRHIEYRNKNGSGQLRWTVITVPGTLTIYGDYGHAFTLQRDVDMLQFLRESMTRINPGYWSGKIISGREHTKKYSREKLHADLASLFSDAISDCHRLEIVDWFTDNADDAGYYTSHVPLARLYDLKLDEYDLDCVDECGCVTLPISITDIDPCYYESVTGEEWSWEWLFACHALAKTAWDWASGREETQKLSK